MVWVWAGLIGIYAVGYGLTEWHSAGASRFEKAVFWALSPVMVPVAAVLGLGWLAGHLSSDDPAPNAGDGGGSR